MNGKIPFEAPFIPLVANHTRSLHLKQHIFLLLLLSHGLPIPPSRYYEDILLMQVE